MKNKLILLLLIFAFACKTPVEIQKNESSDLTEKESISKVLETDQNTDAYRNSEELLSTIRNSIINITVSEFEPILGTDSLGNKSISSFKKKESVYLINDKSEIIKNTAKSDSTLSTTNTVDITDTKTDVKEVVNTKIKEKPKDPHRLRYIFYIIVAVLVGILLVRRFFF